MNIFVRSSLRIMPHAELTFTDLPFLSYTKITLKPRTCSIALLSPLTSHPSTLTSQPSPLNPHLSPLTSHLSTLIPHPLTSSSLRIMSHTKITLNSRTCSIALLSPEFIYGHLWLYLWSFVLNHLFLFEHELP